MIDALYAYYYVCSRREAAVCGGVNRIRDAFLLAFGVINYVGNFLYVIPLALGSFVGTYIVVAREREKD